MKLLCTSDLHGYLPPVAGLPTADVMVIAGDITPVRLQYGPFSQSGKLEQLNWLVKRFMPWLESVLAAKLVRHVVVIWGNHDTCAEVRSMEDNHLWVDDLVWPEGVHVLTNTGIQIDGVNFYGVPQQPRFYDWAFNEDDNWDGLGKRWLAVPPETDVLVTHGPPKWCRDFVGKERVGSRTLTEWLRQTDQPRPRVLVCGHIHSGYGHGQVGNTDVYNVAYVDEQYHPAHDVMVVHVPVMKGLDNESA